MKRSFITFLLLIPCFWLKAGDCLQNKTSTIDELESRKIAYLATAISLNPSEASCFWPVYNEWNQKISANMRTRHAALRQIRQLSKSGSTDEKAYIQQNKILVDGAAEEARLMADAHQAYVSIIGAIRTAKLYLAEEQFRNTLIRELRENAAKTQDRTP